MAITSTPARRWRTASALATVALLLGGCHDSATAADPPQPVLVVHPGAAAGDAAVAFPGEIRAREESVLAFRVGGNLVRRSVDVGDPVRRGQLLAELDPADLNLQAQSAQAQLAAAQAELVRASADRSRYARLAQQQLVSRSMSDAQDAAYAAAAGQVRAMHAQLDVSRNQAGYAQLRAPRDGVIATRNAEAGQVVAAGQPIFELAGDSGREVLIALPESSIRDFHPGEPVLVELWNQPGRRLPGTIREISPSADALARTYAARVTLTDDAAKAVELGQSARVYLRGNGNGIATVPLSAVQRGPAGTVSVWIVDPAKRQAHLRPVRLGAFAADSVPVLSGVTSGDLVVAAGGHLLHEGETVSPVDRDNRPVLPTATATR
ncbi:MAG: efflux transporter periplasmic adaptor subunit [Xanthomonadaceae bacterium]|nr:efflux transporter periplasmic adaptor subunit [Xanthomonadaceae bacterium]